MKKYILKINTFILSFMITMPTLLSYAVSDEELVIRNISNAILSIISWFAYAIAIGALIFFGIKYMMSGANEKANLKGMLPKYLIGVALIVMCFGIAGGIAEIAGNDDAQSIIDVGKEAGNHFSGGGSNNNNNGGNDDSIFGEGPGVNINGDNASNIIIPENKPLTPEEQTEIVGDMLIEGIKDFNNPSRPTFDDIQSIIDNAQNAENNIWADDNTADLIDKQPQNGNTIPGLVPSLEDLAGG